MRALDVHRGDLGCTVLFETTGRELSVGHGGPSVGLSAFGSCRIYGGYDQEVSEMLQDDQQLTYVEVAEMADHMIKRWQTLKAEAREAHES